MTERDLPQGMTTNRHLGEAKEPAKGKWRLSAQQCRREMKTGGLKAKKGFQGGNNQLCQCF